MASKKNSLDKYIDQVGEYYANLPALPKGGRDFIISALPWFALIFGIWKVLTSISAFGVFSYWSPFMWGVGGGFAYQIMLVLGVIAAIFFIAAFPKLRKNQEKGWKLAYYAEIFVLISYVVVFDLAGVLVALLGFYFLYQVRSHYLK